MRELKFRAWNKTHSEMVNFDIYNVPSYVGQTHLEGEKFERNYEIMQYNGLKDKYGAEIYEGDILKRGDFPNEKPEFIVRFGEFTDSPDLYYELEYIGWYVERIGEREKYNTSLVYVIDMLDGIVCGNIYENPELLERK